jgi:hypothetical protein
MGTARHWPLVSGAMPWIMSSPYQSAPSTAIVSLCATSPEENEGSKMEPRSGCRPTPFTGHAHQPVERLHRGLVIEMGSAGVVEQVFATLAHQDLEVRPIQREELRPWRP